HRTHIHGGRTLYLSNATVAIADPLCRTELAAAEDGKYGDDAKRVVAYLANTGPSLADDTRLELGWDAQRFRPARAKLETFGALVAYSRVVHGASGGHRHVGELFRWDQRYDTATNTADALDQLVIAGVRAAVVAPVSEVKRWLSWPLPPNTV